MPRLHLATDFALFVSSSGALLYGSNWKAPTARLLGVSESTLRRWIDGHEPTTYQRSIVRSQFVRAMGLKKGDIINWMRENGAI